MAKTKAKDKVGEFLFPHLEHIGVLPDEEVAQRAGVRTQDVANYRKQNRIAAPPPPAPPPPPKPVRKRVSVDELRIDGGTQQREAMDLQVVAEYAEVLRQGKDLSAVRAVDDGEDLWLFDGFHRLAAYKEAERPEIEVDVEQGDRRRAVLLSVGVNAKHGLRRTNADKRKAVMTMLADEEWGTWEGTKIAEVVDVTSQFVNKIKRELAEGIADDETVSEPGARPRPWPLQKKNQRTWILECVDEQALNDLLRSPDLNPENVNDANKQVRIIHEIHRSSLDQVMDQYHWWCKTPTSPFWPLVCAHLDDLASEPQRGHVDHAVGTIRMPAGDPNLCWTRDQARALLSVRGWTLEQRQMLLLCGRYSSALKHDHDYYAREALECPGLPEMLLDKLQERIRALERQADTEPAGPPEWSPWDLEGKPVDQFRATLAERPEVAKSLLAIEQGGKKGRRPEVMELILRTLKDQEVPIRTCPDPRCKWIQADVPGSCARCYRSPKDAEKQWKSDVEDAAQILQMEEQIRGKPAGAPAEPAPATSHPIARMTMKWMGMGVDFPRMTLADRMMVALLPEEDWQLDALEEYHDLVVELHAPGSPPFRAPPRMLGRMRLVHAGRFDEVGELDVEPETKVVVLCGTAEVAEEIEWQDRNGRDVMVTAAPALDEDPDRDGDLDAPDRDIDEDDNG